MTRTRSAAAWIKSITLLITDPKGKHFDSTSVRLLAMLSTRDLSSQSSHSSDTNGCIDHCLNYVRQEIMCHGDLTPMEWKRGFLGLELKSGQVRTCRDFGSLDSWAKERKGRAVLPHSGEQVSHSG
jgi:hypothetical protein